MAVKSKNNESDVAAWMRTESAKVRTKNRWNGVRQRKTQWEEKKFLLKSP
jgi:hypothetical protein